MINRYLLLPIRILPILALCPALSLAGPTALDFKAETKLNYRSSQLNRFPVGFPFPAEALPPGQSTAFIKTVDQGKHVEISNVALMWHWQLSENFSVLAKVDAFDLYERNPTSEDHKVSLDRFILRYGTRHTQGNLPENTDFYLQFGKFGKFERQEDRHLESYGLVSTAFNRVEDSGFETGIDFPSGFYGKLSWTTGNPVFIRDPNALAGDNGTVENPPPNNDPELKSGIVILYDAEVEDIDLSENPELGAALGYRWVSGSSANRINFMLFNYEREMADTVELHGTFYGGDLDILDVSEVLLGIAMPTSHTDKKESGANLWWYGGNFSLFGQYVKQDIAGLKRDGWEVELAYAFNTNGWLSDNIKLERIVPVVRYSEIDNDFVGHPQFPSPSIWWDWDKTDIGFNLDFKGDIQLTAEYAENEFIRGGKEENNDEFLLTLTWRYD